MINTTFENQWFFIYLEKSGIRELKIPIMHNKKLGTKTKEIITINNKLNKQ